MRRVTTRAFQRDFARIQDEAVKSPVAITRHRKDWLVILSFEEYERLKRRDRRALAVEELSDAELEAISKAEVPVPNRETVEAMNAARRGELVTVGTVDELVTDLNSEE